MKKLTWTQRVAIEDGIKEGKSNAQIARELGVHRATIGREIARNASCRENYAARTADDASWQRQQEAMPKRFLVRFNGVEYLTSLQKHHRIYTYLSRTHLNALSCFANNSFPNWDTGYIRLNEIDRFVPDEYYERFRFESLTDNWNLLLSTTSPFYLPGNAHLQQKRCFKNINQPAEDRFPTYLPPMQLTKPLADRDHSQEFEGLNILLGVIMSNRKLLEEHTRPKHDLVLSDLPETHRKAGHQLSEAEKSRPFSVETSAVFFTCRSVAI